MGDRKEYYEINRGKILSQQKEYYIQNESKKREQARQRYRKNIDIRQSQFKELQKRLYDNANKSLLAGNILNLEDWIRWFNNKNDVSRYTIYDISPYDAFNLMVQRCLYCGDIAMTLDRLDSCLSHTSTNCVGCCSDCNQSKGAMDPLTFVLQAVYRRKFIYYEDDYIWHNNKYKPNYGTYKSKADKQGRTFSLTKDQFNNFTNGMCHYCKRYPPKGKFFGIDKINPDDGYVMINCVTACASCNWAKWDSMPDEFSLREERISERYLAGYFNMIPYIPKNVNHR
jgi:5-methylcytosine-specific restriction endonuclease McrA